MISIIMSTNASMIMSLIMHQKIEKRTKTKIKAKTKKIETLRAKTARKSQKKKKFAFVNFKCTKT